MYFFASDILLISIFIILLKVTVEFFLQRKLNVYIFLVLVSQGQIYIYQNIHQTKKLQKWFLKYFVLIFGYSNI